MSGIDIYPAYQEVVLTKPNEIKVISFTLQNNQKNPISFTLVPRDFKQSTAPGIITFMGQAARGYSYSLASFLSLETNTVTLDPGEKRTVSAQIKNRDDLSPGGHYAALIAEAVPTENMNGTQVMPSLAAMLLLRKTGGERYAIKLITNSLSKIPIQFSLPSSATVTLQNEGNVHVVPYGTLVLTNALNKTIKKGILNSSSLYLLPETRREVSSTLQSVSQPMPIDYITTTLQGSDALHKTDYNTSFSYVYIAPWFLFLSIVFIVSVIAVLWRIRRKKHS